MSKIISFGRVIGSDLIQTRNGNLLLVRRKLTPYEIKRLLHEKQIGGSEKIPRPLPRHHPLEK